MRMKHDTRALYIIELYCVKPSSFVKSLGKTKPKKRIKINENANDSVFHSSEPRSRILLEEFGKLFCRCVRVPYIHLRTMDKSNKTTIIILVKLYPLAEH